MTWQVMTSPRQKIIDIESDRHIFEIPVGIKITQIKEVDVMIPQFFKPIFFTTETLQQGYGLLLKSSTGLLRILPGTRKKKKAEFEDYDLLADYAIGALPKISDDLSDSVKFGPWADSLEGLAEISTELRSGFDNLQIDAISGFYKAITKWALQMLPRNQSKYITDKLRTLKEEVYI